MNYGGGATSQTPRCDAIKQNVFGACVTEKPAAFLGCVSCILVNTTNYIRHLRYGEACGLLEVREMQINQQNTMYSALALRRSMRLP